MDESRLTLSYAECRDRFRRACSEAGVAWDAHEIAARGSEGEVLTIDTAWIGARHPRRALAVLSGVHGVEAFLPSALQREFVRTAASADLSDGVGVLLVHAVNPWGMSWWRRQNESNVDLNRNWRRDEVSPRQNDAYDDIHGLLHADSDEIPAVDEMMRTLASLVDERGLPWVRDAITIGQYRHPDGLHYGGARTEESCAVLEHVVESHLCGVEFALTLDLHTGHGRRGDVTFLCDRPPGSDRHEFLGRVFGFDAVEATVGDPDATTANKSGQIANGFEDLLDGATAHATSVEWGTTPDTEQIAATYLENWVRRRGDLADPEHAAIVRRYRECFTPDDPSWQRNGTESGRRLLAAALHAVVAWNGL